MMEGSAACFAGLSDPRETSRCDHRLVDILAIAVRAVIACAESWEDIELYGRSKRIVRPYDPLARRAIRRPCRCRTSASTYPYWGSPAGAVGPGAIRKPSAETGTPSDWSGGNRGGPAG